VAAERRARRLAHFYEWKCDAMIDHDNHISHNQNRSAKAADVAAEFCASPAV
jgi:hypothetical protein